MKIKKIYFNRMYDQWRGEPLYVEDGLDDDKLYVRIMDVPNYKEGAVNVIIADYKDLIGGTYTVLGQMDFDKKLAIFKIPLSILSNNGIYEVVFSLSFNAKDKEGLLLKTPIQTFEIIDTIEADNEAIAQDPHYPILVDLINQLAEYKVDTSVFPTREEMMKAIEENLNENSMDEILKEIQANGYITLDKLNIILKNYTSKEDLDGYVKEGDLDKFITSLQLVQELNKYVLKEKGKGLSTHDLTDDLYEKLVNLNIKEGEISINLSDYQKVTDNTLETNNKTITGAINEVNKTLITHEDNISKILEVVDKPPTFTNPTINISVSKAIIQHNILTNITITPSFSKNDAGNITSYLLKKGDEVLVNSSSIQTYIDSNILMSHGSSITYTATVEYGDGENKTSDFGVEYQGIKAGSINTNSTIKAYALSYYGVIDSAETINVSTLTSRLSTSKSYIATYNMTKQRSVYMYPKSFGTLNSIKDSNNFEYINSYTRSEMTYNNVYYYVYILTDPVTITNFKQIFN